MTVGAHYRKEGGCDFTVWAPLRDRVAVKLLAPQERTVPMEKDARGYWRASIDDVPPGTQYLFRLDDALDRPDPASRFQPRGVHGPSAVVDHMAFGWEDGAWKGIPLPAYVLYELHVGAFTAEGTFDAILRRLGSLADLGVTAIELMPVTQFPGRRNWGYDGVYPYAVQDSYGGPEGLKRLVNACHRQGLAVVLDVVYNHLGPEGNYLGDYGPYFTDRYRTPWGDAINFDGPSSDAVREFFLQSALAWIVDYHIDGLRIDAIHGIFDFSARHFLRDLGEAAYHAAAGLGRAVAVIPESDLNDVRAITPRELGGYGLDGQWNDDFHHCVHTLLTGERSGYYEDFGTLEHLAKAYREGFVYSGQYSPYRKRRHGNSSRTRPAHQFVVFSQNHDQVGNRMQGDRLAALVSFEALKLAAVCVILSPFVPLLFMGEEYGEDAPFLYFVDHSDPALIEAVRNGRKEEFRAFSWEGEPPDPQAEETFRRARIDWTKRCQGRHGSLLALYHALIGLRRDLPVLTAPAAEATVRAIDQLLILERTLPDGEATLCLLNFARQDNKHITCLPGGAWDLVLDSADVAWDGPGGLLPLQVRGEERLAMRAASAALFRLRR